MIVAIMAAVARNRVIGKDNDLVWHLPADLRHFKKTTSGHYVIMGRKTFESIPQALPNRVNIVVTRNSAYSAPGCVVCGNLDEALNYAETRGQKKVFILGGGDIYRQALRLADAMYLTEIHADFGGDTYFPEYDRGEWQEVFREDHPADAVNAYPYSFVEYRRKSSVAALPE
jgi:dihydrofolate reductase